MRISEMDFCVPSSQMRKSDKDISVSLYKDNRISFIARNDVEKLITISGNVGVLIFGNRIYFKEVEQGYRFYKKDNKSSANFKFKYEMFGISTNKIKSFIGDYDLLFDEEEQLYYIEREK